MNPKIKFSKTKAIHLTFKPVIAIKIPQNEFMNKIINLKFCFELFTKHVW